MTLNDSSWLFVTLRDSWKDWWGRQRNVASRNILVERCRVTRGHAVSVGSETSGGVYNVLFRSIELDGDAKQVSHTDSRGTVSCKTSLRASGGGFTALEGGFAASGGGFTASYDIERQESAG
eukprot:942029-Prorocentrum_minimum.AAC.2